MKYTKEFVDLCSNWIRGSITDKSFFKDYQEIMLKEAIKTTGFRIWTFEGEELKDVIFNQGDIEIEQNIIESCFVLPKEDLVDPYSDIKQHIDSDKIDDIQRWISPYLDKFRIITRWENSIYFDIYKVLEYGINEYNNGNKEYSKNDFETYTTRLKKYSNQQEMLHLGEYDNISSDEIIYIMVEQGFLNNVMNEELREAIYGETENYYIFYNDQETRDAILNSELKYDFHNLGELLRGF